MTADLRWPGYPVASAGIPDESISAGAYDLRFARDGHDLEAILRLRYRVFNLELGEGLVSSDATGLDDDGLDVRFHHLLITERRSGEVVGTYRMQTAEMARSGGGWYTTCVFDLSTIPEQLLDTAVEVGRACVARDHRNGRVLHLLWRGLAGYLAWNRKTALFGCCSLTSQDPALGVSTLAHLADLGHLHPGITVAPQPATRCEVAPDAALALPAPHIPTLFQSYLNLGAKVCGPPAIDREFQTIDFLVLLDANQLSPRVMRSFFR